MSSPPAAAVRVRKMPIIVVSNDGASSSWDRSKVHSPEIAESSPRKGSSSPKTSNHSTPATSSSSIYSDRDEPSTCPLLAPREYGLNYALGRRACGGSTRYPTPVPEPLQESVSRARARADSPDPPSQPTLMSRRLSLASFVSRLFTRSNKGQHAPALLQAREDDRKESERLRRWSAGRACLPLR